MRISTRLPVHTAANRLTQALDEARAQGRRLIDLTQTNPTRAGIGYPENLLEPLSDSRGLDYAPDPRGHYDARVAVARDCARRGAAVDPANIVLTASTSEAYSWVFKLLCDPGDAVLVPRPSYPLFEYLTGLEGVRAVPYDLEYHGRWDINPAGFNDSPANVRAVLVVSPNNPTGSYISGSAHGPITEFCRTRRCALVVDEVFADYSLEAVDPETDLAARAEVLTFTFAGLSKTVGLPQVKLAWIIVGGPDDERRAAVSGLELVADSFLSVGTPVQLAAPSLLDRGASVRHAIHGRVRQNLAALRRVAALHPACDVLKNEGGWSAVVRVPATRDEETLSLHLLERENVLVHPGFFFDFQSEAYLVLSLLAPEDDFVEGASRTLRAASL